MTELKTTLTAFKHIFRTRRDGLVFENSAQIIGIKDGFLIRADKTNAKKVRWYSHPLVLVGYTGISSGDYL